MTIHFGTVKPGTTLYIPFHTFDSNDPSASVTISGLATTDIEVYKDGGTTQRASDSGYALLDTDGIDFDGTTGIHGISIDLSDNTTDDFYEAGHQFMVVIASITVDAATVNFIAATFDIGYPGALLNTVIATRTDATNFILETGSADDDAYNGCVVYIHDQASAVQFEIGYCSDYDGGTKTLILEADPGVFTTVAGDNISLFPPSYGNMIADHVLRRQYTNARQSSFGDTVLFRSLLGAVGKLVNRWAISGSTLTVYQEDDSTSTAPGGTQTITGTAGADPITQIDTD